MTTTKRLTETRRQTLREVGAFSARSTFYALREMDSEYRDELAQLWSVSIETSWVAYSNGPDFMFTQDELEPLTWDHLSRLFNRMREEIELGMRRQVESGQHEPRTAEYRTDGALKRAAQWRRITVRP